MSLEGSRFLFNYLTRSLPVECKGEMGEVDITDKAQAGFEFALDALTMGGFTSMRIMDGDDKYSRLQGRYSEVLLKGKQGKYSVAMYSVQDYETTMWLFIRDVDFPFSGRQTFLQRRTYSTETDSGEKLLQESSYFNHTVVVENRILNLDDKQVLQFFDEVQDCEIDEEATERAYFEAVQYSLTNQGNDRIVSVQWNMENEKGPNFA